MIPNRVALPPATPPRILIIEDDEASLRLMAYLFLAFGYEPVLAHNGDEGLKAAATSAPDVIVSDLLMAGIDGYQVLRRLKSNPTLNHIPVVAVTVLAASKEREKALGAGFDGYITKPIAAETFVRQIEDYLSPARRSNQAPPAAPDHATVQPQACPSKRATILVVDDSEANLLLFTSILEPFGYTVLTAQDGEVAFQIAQTHRPDLIVSDVHMPALSGYELAWRINDDSRLATIPLILISSGSSPRVEPTDPLKAREIRVLRRPLDPQEVLDVIRSYVG